MKNRFHLQHHGMFLARTPLLPLQVFQQFADSDDPTIFLRQIYAQPLLRNALYLASPTLYDRLLAWTAARPEPDGAGGQVAAPISPKQAAARSQEQEKLCLALCKYLVRASYRCTPFGLFAAVTPGRVAAHSDWQGLDDAPLQARLRFDFALQAQLVQSALADPALRRKLNYQANNSVSLYGNKIYYVEAASAPAQANQPAYKHYHLTQLEREPYLDSLLALARLPQSWQAMQQHLVQVAGVDARSADDFLHELIDSEVLMAVWGIKITGEDCFASLQQGLQQLGEGERLAPWRDLLAALPSRPQAANWAGQLDAAWRQLAHWPGHSALRKHVFQVDSLRAATPTLAQALVQRIASACTALAHMSMRKNSGLDDFKQRFAKRFEDKQVALHQLFNDETGLPFRASGKVVSDLLQGIEFPQRSQQGAQALQWDGLDRLLFQKYEQALQQGLQQIEISNSEWQQLAGANKMRLQGGVYALVSLFGDVDGNLDADGAGKVGVYLQAAGGSTGAELLGRFCDLDPALCDDVRTLLERVREGQPAAGQAGAHDAGADSAPVYAEVVHLPQDRVVNVVARPQLSEYEICYLGQGVCAPERQIWVSDLLVSLQNKRLVLYSQRLQREVRPRLSCAHNHGGNNLAIYQFLCALAQQDQPWFGFQWSSVFRSASFLPRVSLDGVILAPARWMLDKQALDGLRSAQQAGPAALLAWRSARKLPRFVSWDVGDNVLPVDWDNPMLVAMLLDEIKQQHRVELREALALEFGPAPGLARTVEVILPLQVATEAAAADAAAVTAAATIPAPPVRHQAGLVSHDERHLLPPYCYLPGSPWTYFKIYCGASQADELLCQFLVPLLRQQQQGGSIVQWFFIRYHDPEPHLRLRALSATGADALAFCAALSQVCQSAIASGLVWSVVSDSYQREVQRYGGLAAMQACETLFHLDSQLVHDFIASERASTVPASVARRCWFGLLWVQQILDAFFPDENEKQQVITHMAASFQTEFGFGSRQKAQLGARFRSYRAELEQLVWGRSGDAASLAQRAHWQAIIAPHLPALQATVLHIRQLGAGLETTLAQLVPSLIHMHCNRLFAANQRAHEVVFYDFLVRVVESERARTRIQTQHR